MKRIIAIPVQQISDISELSAPDGTRQLDFPYFVDDGSNGWDYCMINERTDPDKLTQLIQAGKVYVYWDINQ